MIVTHELEACVDCLMWVANGEATDEHAARIASQRPGVEHIIVACNEDCEGPFSWRPCEVCGSTLGGERHKVAILASGEARA